MVRLYLSIAILLMVCSIASGQTCSGYSYGTPGSSYLFNLNGDNLRLPVDEAYKNVQIDYYKSCTLSWPGGGCLEYRSYKVYREIKYFYACSGWLYQPNPDPLVVENDFDITGTGNRCFGFHANRNSVGCDFIGVSTGLTPGNYNLEYVKLEIIRKYRTKEWDYNESEPTTFSLHSTSITFTKIKNVSIATEDYEWNRAIATTLCPNGTINFKSFINNSTGVTFSIASGGGAITTAGVYTTGSYTGSVKVRATKTFGNGGATHLEHTFVVNGVSTIQSSLPSAICSDAPSINLTSHFSYLDDVTATYSSPSHAGSVSGTTFNPGFSGTPATPINVTVRCQVSANGCSGTKDVVITVTPGGWSVNPGTSFDICSSASLKTLSGTPANGGGYSAAWSGVGVSGTQFNPAAAGLTEGVATPLLYTVNKSGCIKSATITATVRPIPDISVGIPTVSPNCGATSINLLTSMIPKDHGSNISSSLTWSSSNSSVNSRISGNVLSTSGIALGTYPLTLTYQNPFGCSQSITIPAAVSLNSNGIVDPVVADSLRCGPGEGYLTVDNYDPDNDYYWYASASGGPTIGTGKTLQTPYLTTSTPYWVETKKLTCGSGRKKANVIIVNHTASAGTPLTICEPENVNISLSGSPSGGVWTGPGVTGNTFNSFSLQPDNQYNLTYTYKEGHCVYTATKPVSIGIPATLQVNPADSVYPGQKVLLSHTLANATEALWTISYPDGAQTNFTGNSTPFYFYKTGRNVISVVITNPSDCQREISTSITVIEVDVITGVETPFIKDISVYPNPFMNGVNIVAGQLLERAEISIVDSNGSLVFSDYKTLTEKPTSLDLTNALTPGIYILRVVYKNHVKNFKLIKH